MTDFVGYPGSNSDSGFIYTINGGSTWQFSNQPTSGINKWISMGEYTNVEYRMFIRFPNVTVPKGAIINSVQIRLYITNYWHGNFVDSKFNFEKSSNPNAISSVYDYNARSKTTNYKDIEFYEPYFPSGYVTIQDLGGDTDLKDIITEVIGQSGWESGNAMQLIVRPYYTSYAAINFWATSTSYMRLTISYTYTVPDPPTSLSVSRISDNSHYLTWTNNSASGKPYTSIVVQRSSDDFLTYTNVVLSSSSTNYTDNSTQDNNVYKWRVKARNYVGDSTYATSSEVKTTPASPSNLVGYRTSGNTINLEFDNNSPYANSIIVEKALGPSYSSWSAIALSPLAGNAVSTQNDEASQCKFRARSAVTYSSLTSSNTESNIINAPSTPNVPTNLNPDNNQIIDYDEDNIFSWQHNPTDSSIQNKYSLRYREYGGSWVNYKTEEVSTVQSVSIPAGTFTAGITYEFEVATWGVYATGSDWSSIATFIAKTKPVCSITSPADTSTYGLTVLEVSWTFYDADSDTQAQAVITLFDEDDNILSTGNVYGAELTYTFEDIYVYTDTNYKLTIQVKDSLGLWSTVDTSEFSVEFYVPPKPVLDLEYNNIDGGCHISITNNTPSGDEVATSYNRLYKSIDGVTYELLYDNIPENTNVIDYTPMLKGITYYYCMAVSETPTFNKGYIYELNNDLTGIFFINSGSNYSLYQKIIMNVNFSESRDREKSLIEFEGREYSIKFQGVSKNREINFSFDMLNEDYDNLVEIIESLDDMFFRDWRGRHFKCSISNTVFKNSGNSMLSVSCIVSKIS